MKLPESPNCFSEISMIEESYWNHDGQFPDHDWNPLHHLGIRQELNVPIPF